MSTSSTKSVKKTREKLANTPFSSVKEMESVERDINLKNWKRLATYRDFKNQLKNDSNIELRQDLETGVMCGYQDDNDENPKSGDSSILRVYKAEAGIQVKINEKKPAEPRLISNLASGMVHSFGSLYYELSGLKAPTPITDLEGDGDSS